jgi:predicted kinase
MTGGGAAEGVPGAVFVVAGPPGCGKTTVSRLLLERLRPVPAHLDKDTMYGPFVSAVLDAHGRDPGEREGPWYDEHVKRHEYAGMTTTAREIRAHGCPVLLSGPFTGQIRSPERWAGWVAELGGPPVRLVWIRTDAATLRRRLTDRGSHRDTGKLADFGAFLGRMRPEEPPPVPHVALDNRLAAPVPLEEQVARRVAGLTG